MTTLTLTKPIESLGEAVSILTFRKPTGKDIRQCGLPTLFDREGNAKIDTEAAARLIQRLANVTVIALDQMEAADFAAAIGIVCDFSVAPGETSSGAIGS